MTRRNALISLAAAGLWIGAGGLLSACSPSKPQFHAVDITGADYAKQFQLTDFNGRARTLEDFKGKVVVIFFGYTQCPDVCPATMSAMAEVKHKLGADGDKLQVLFVSVDPERDKPEVLKAYMDSFDPTFLALYADSPEKLAALAMDFKVYFKKAEGKTPTSYTVDHSAQSYIYDPQGRLRLFARYGMSTDHIASDVKLLLQGA